MNEIWDITDAEGRPTGRTMEKGTPMRPGEYHLSVSVWIVNDSGEFLISRRVPGKKAAPGMWEAAGGSALAGEDALTAALREVKEELGLVLDPGEGSCLFEVYMAPFRRKRCRLYRCLDLPAGGGALRTVPAEGGDLRREMGLEGGAARPDPGREDDPVHLYRGTAPAYGKDGAKCTVS